MFKFTFQNMIPNCSFIRYFCYGRSPKSYLEFFVNCICLEQQKVFLAIRLEHFCCRRSHKSYRPLTVLTFRLTHSIFGLNPIPFHIGNIALHTTITLLTHHIVR